MRYTNYDIIETEGGELFLYLSSSYYKLTGDPLAESHARKNIKADFGKHKKTGNLRQWIGEAIPKEKETLAATTTARADIVDKDVSAKWREAAAISADMFEYHTRVDEDGVTIRTPKVPDLTALYDGT